MKDQLQRIADSYDKGVDFGRKGIDLYDDLPEYITSHPDYSKVQKLRDEGSLSDSGRNEVMDYLSPSKDMNFVDLGCCLNFMFNGYDKWPSRYYGLDISPKTIQLLKEYASKNKLPIGSFDCASIHKTPYGDSCFDIGACIGILEYFEKEFVTEAIKEFHRIMIPGAKFILDIPNLESPIFKITKLIEGYLGREDKFDMTEKEFNELLQTYFTINKTEDVAGMTQYFLVNK